MNLQPSTSTYYNDRRILFSKELEFGGHGQIFLSGAGTFTPPDEYVFYRINFLTTAVVNNIVFRGTNSDGEVIYNATASQFAGKTFPAGTTWNAPLTSITLDSGTGIAYTYKKFIPEDLIWV